MKYNIGDKVELVFKDVHYIGLIIDLDKEREDYFICFKEKNNTRNRWFKEYELYKIINQGETNFSKITKEMNEIYELKNEKYGDSFGKSIDKYGMIAALTRISDKFNRLEQMILNSDVGTEDERLEDTLMDMANYCVMTLIETKKKG